MAPARIEMEYGTREDPWRSTIGGIRNGHTVWATTEDNRRVLIIGTPVGYDVVDIMSGGIQVVKKGGEIRLKEGEIVTATETVGLKIEKGLDILEDVLRESYEDL